MMDLDNLKQLHAYLAREDVAAAIEYEARDLVEHWDLKQRDAQSDDSNMKMLLAAMQADFINQALKMNIDEGDELLEKLWRDTLKYESQILSIWPCVETHYAELYALAQTFVHDIARIDEKDLISNAIEATLVNLRNKRESSRPTEITYMVAFLRRTIIHKGIDEREKEFGSRERQQRQVDPPTQETAPARRPAFLLPLPLISLEVEAAKNDHIVPVLAPELEQPDKIILDLENYRELQQLLDFVPPKSRGVLLLYINMYQRKEIADELHIPENTVKNDLSRWIPRLRKKYYELYPARKDEVARMITNLPTTEEEKAMVRAYIIECRTYTMIGEGCVPIKESKVVEAIVTKWSRKLRYSLLNEE